MLLDTSGLLCLINRVEPFHAQACSLYRSASVRITHNYVLAEFVALANARRFPRAVTLDFLDDLSHGHDVETVWIDPAIHAEAMALLKQRLDKTYSLCDSVSFVLMQRRAIDEALTTDHHFTQEGFRRLLV